MLLLFLNPQFFGAVARQTGKCEKEEQGRDSENKNKRTFMKLTQNVSIYTQCLFIIIALNRFYDWIFN